MNTHVSPPTRFGQAILLAAAGMVGALGVPAQAGPIQSLEDCIKDCIKNHKAFTDAFDKCIYVCNGGDPMYWHSPFRRYWDPVYCTGIGQLNDLPFLDWSAGGTVIVAFDINSSPLGQPIDYIDFRLFNHTFDSVEPFGTQLGVADGGGLLEGVFMCELDADPFRQMDGVVTALIHPVPDSTGAWDQSDYDPKYPALADQDFPDHPEFSIYGVGDFTTNEQTWDVTAVRTFYTKGYGAWNESITQGRLQVFAKSGASPSDEDQAPEYSVPLTLIDHGDRWEAVADATGIPELQGIRGEYWIGLTPVADFDTYGQEYRLTSATPGGDSPDKTGYLRNPGNGFGLGTGWLPSEELKGKASELSFTVDFRLVGAPDVQVASFIYMRGEDPGQDCYADFDGSGALDIFDFLGFVNTFNAGDGEADCTQDGGKDIFNFLCFVNAFNAGC
jgi:hypothetical protein